MEAPVLARARAIPCPLFDEKAAPPRLVISSSLSVRRCTVSGNKTYMPRVPPVIKAVLPDNPNRDSRNDILKWFCMKLEDRSCSKKWAQCGRGRQANAVGTPIAPPYPRVPSSSVSPSFLLHSSLPLSTPHLPPAPNLLKYDCQSSYDHCLPCGSLYPWG